MKKLLINYQEGAQFRGDSIADAARNATISGTIVDEDDKVWGRANIPYSDIMGGRSGDVLELDDGVEVELDSQESTAQADIEVALSTVSCPSKRGWRKAANAWLKTAQKMHQTKLRMKQIQEEDTVSTKYKLHTDETIIINGVKYTTVLEVFDNEGQLAEERYFEKPSYAEEFLYYKRRNRDAPLCIPHGLSSRAIQDEKDRQRVMEWRKEPVEMPEVIALGRN